MTGAGLMKPCATKTYEPSPLRRAEALRYRELKHLRTTFR